MLTEYNRPLGVESDISCRLLQSRDFYEEGGRAVQVGRGSVSHVSHFLPQRPLRRLPSPPATPATFPKRPLASVAPFFSSRDSKSGASIAGKARSKTSGLQGIARKAGGKAVKVAALLKAPARRPALPASAPTAAFAAFGRVAAHICANTRHLHVETRVGRISQIGPNSTWRRSKGSPTEPGSSCSSVLEWSMSKRAAPSGIFPMDT
mmetsp:Transcript_5466/g.8125  ORF Transcript_5466/g.8125 Transcript_5466/m.8125 type:complete len:207 (+) Transcript_5466:6-626(+)